jgi:hypothetical protein
LPGEGEEHKRIRKRVEKEAQSYLESTGRGASHRIRAAHQKGAGTIGLYMGHPSRATRMSDADLVIVDDSNEAVCIIEVKDEDVRPKNLFGIVGATSLCDTVRHNAFDDLRLGRAALYIVVNAENLGKPQSTKRKQIELINKELAGGFGSIGRVVICSEDDFAKLFKL